MMNIKKELYRIAAEIAQRKGMPDPDSWSGWSNRVPQKLYRAALNASETADKQCSDWAYILGLIAKEIDK